MGFGRNEAVEGLFNDRETGFPIGLSVHRDDMTNFNERRQAGRVETGRRLGLLFPRLEWKIGVA